MNYLTKTARILTGLLFILSGFVKGVDPMGTAFKLGEYFTAFNMEFLDGLSLPLSIFLCLVEFVSGMMLLTGALVKPASWMALLFMVIFTPLTLILAIFNPVSDCGCFGDAFILSNWQTFYKNIIITIPVVFVFLRRNDETGVMPLKTGLNVTIAFIFFFLIFMRMNLAYLPALDFRPYKVGANIQEAMSIPEDAEPDKYDIRFIYEKDGVRQEFNLNDYPANDTSWKFIDQKSVLISRGYVPPIHDFTLIDSSGIDQTDYISGYEGDMVLMVARRLENSDRDGLMKGFNLGMELQKQGREFYIVTATTPAVAEPMITGFSALYADEITLKTVIRSDPGFILLHNGTIAAKWSYHNLPDLKELSGDLNTLALKSLKQNINRLTVTIAILCIILAVVLTLPYTGRNLKRTNK